MTTEVPSRIMVTGHRPDKLGGYKNYNKHNLIKQRMLQVLSSIISTGCKLEGITGMALGADQFFAECCVQLSIPFHAFIPYDGQESRWPSPAQEKYQTLLKSSAGVHITADRQKMKSSYDFSKALMQRNSDMIAFSPLGAIVVWDGSSGGTLDTVKKLNKINLPSVLIDPGNIDLNAPISWEVTSPYKDRRSILKR